MERRDRASGTTGIRFPSTQGSNSSARMSSRPNQRRSAATSAGTGNRSTGHFVFVPTERGTFVPAPVPVQRVSGATASPLRTPVGKVAPKWVPDDQAPSCTGCGVSFGFTTRRHHCRACGEVFCGACSGVKAKLEHLDFKEARVCTGCHGELNKDASESMGAGVVKPQPDGRPGFQIHINTTGGVGGGGTQMPGGRSNQAASKCEECDVTFSAFKKRKPCKDCARDFCSACTVQVNGASPRQQQCRKCQTLQSGEFTRAQLLNWKVKDLKAVLTNQNVNTTKCKEKNDLIDLVFNSFGGNPGLSRRGTEHERLVEQLAEKMRRETQSDQRSGPQQTTPSGSTTSSSSTSRPANSTPTNPTPTNPTPANSTPRQASQTQEETIREAQRLLERREREMREAEVRMRMREAMEEEEKNEAPPVNLNLQLDDVKTEAEIESLNIKSLKRLLLNNFVDYKGCCERWELQERVKRLWRDNEANKKKAEEQRKISDDPATAPTTTTSGEDEICKICMDAAIDCVLLECGHMVTCTKCGKRLSECPICRQYVVRAVHTFKS